ncbi:MAG: phosphodiester glycosidase family protein [Odoribacter sp.]|nr:phosphodiester glycosidase family protein [Odoribacter sp.]
MNKSLLIASTLLIAGSATAMAETIDLGGKSYTIDRLIERQIGPGTTYMRLRLPDYPLNVNVVTVDLNDPYNRIETTVAKESSRGTESLVTAAKRQSSEGHRPLAAANANFWIVSSQPENGVWSGITRNVSLRNGKMITESNQHRDQWDGGTMRTGIVSVSYDKVLNIDYCTSDIKIWSDKFGPTEVHMCNKGFWSDEIGMYNSHFGSTAKFMPINSNGTYYIENGLTDVTEVWLDFDEGQEWVSGTEMTFVVKEVLTGTDGQGTLGNHDLALCGRGDNAAILAALAAGDKLQLRYTWTFNPGTEQEVTPLVEQAIGGNALVMRGGELLDHNYNEAYNSQIYSRTGYGCSADGKTLYIVVIDKSTDPVYGTSKGCGTDVMCLIAKHLGCYNMANFDAGGSAEMMVNNEIINKTTEGTPRAVANGWMVYSIAPEDDNTVARLEFYDNVLQQPIYASAAPQVIAYNKYGAVVDYDFKDVTYSCSEGLGTCEDGLFIASSTPGTGTLTAHYGDVSVTKDIEIVNAAVAMRSDFILIDATREYPIEVQAIADKKTYLYDPSFLEWTVEDPEIASIDENGVLRGIKTGTTTITGTIGPESVTATVTVEIASAADMLAHPFSGWTVKGASGMSNVSMDENGLINFTFGSRRTGHIELSQKELKVYSLPDAIYADFTSSVPVASISVDILPANASRVVAYKIEPSASYAAGESHRVDFDLEGNGIDLKDMAVFPLAVRRVRFTFETLSSNTGDQTFNLAGIYANYKNFDGVENIIAPDGETRLAVSPNPATAGSDVAIKAHGISSVAVYSISGALVYQSVCDGSADSTSFTAPSSGTYVVSAMTANGPASAVLIVR